MGNVVQEPDQLTLFDMGGVDVAKLREAQAKLLVQTEAPNTRSAYGSAWKMFAAWCAECGRSPLPAKEETVCLYLTHLLEVRGLRVATAELHKSAIAAQHRAAGLKLHINGGVSALLRGAKRAKAGEVSAKVKAAITVGELKRMSAKLLAGGDRLDVRDRAMICLGFAGGFRRSELTALKLEDAEFVAQGLLIHIRKGKRDQEGIGRDVGLHRHSAKAADICPVRALRAWLKVRGDAPGALFISYERGSGPEVHLKGNAVCQAVQRACQLIGLDRDRYGAHSLRAGLVTACLAAGASELAVMQRTGHKQVSTLQRYLRPATAFQVDPLAKALA